MTILATLVALGAPVYGNALNTARITKAVADIRVLEKEVEVYRLFSGVIPDTLADLKRENFLDPYGNPYRYLNYKNAKQSNKWGGTKTGTEKPRKDRFLVPLNSEYDLYSMGKDGESREALTAHESWDDIVRANDGGFVGLAAKY